MGGDTILWLYGLQQFGIKLGLGGIRALLERLGSPERSFPSVLVGGTNGKGSVGAMLDSMLGAHGLRAGFYSSPHLVRPTERIRIGGLDAGEADLRRWLETARRASETAVADGALEAHPSFFEVMTAAALLGFREAGLDVAVLEVGLGGRLDATNAVEPRVSCIVTVDLDHTERLGGTLREIAIEKAGIVRRGRPVVSGAVRPEAVDAIRERCRDEGAPLVEARAVASLSEDAGRGAFRVETARGAYDRLRLGLPGIHQRDNARVAVVLLEEIGSALGFEVSPDAVRRGLAAVRWPGRLQWVAGDPPVLLDGAHNPAGAETLAGYLRERGGPAPVLLFAAAAGKDVAGILEPLRGLVARAVVTRPPVERAADPAPLASVATGLGLPAEVVPAPGAALDRARRLAKDGSFVLVAGSLYLVGTVLSLLEGGDAPGPVSS